MRAKNAFKFLCKLGAIGWGLFCANPSHAAIELHTSLADFIQVAGPTDALITNPLGVSRATEVTGAPTQNLSLGNTLTFEQGNTQFDFSFEITADVSPATFVFEDNEPPAGTPTTFIHALSVGDIDNVENDNWSLSLLNSAWVSALGVDVRDNNFQNGATTPSTMETLTVFSNTGANLATFDLSSLNLGSPPNQFLGVVATDGERIGRIVFNEDNGGDDIAIANFRFSTNVETPATAMHAPRRSAASALTLNNKLVISGGSTSGISGERGTTSTEYLDLNTGEFIQAGNLNIGRENHTITLLPNGNLLATGGSDSNFVSLSSAEIFDVSSGTWQLVPPMSTARSSHTATRLYDGRVLVIGGGAGSSTYEIFDPTTNTWSAAKALSPSRTGHAVALAADGKVWVTGGNTSQQATSIYDPASDTWSAGPDMNLARFAHIMVTLADGRIAVLGNVRQGNNTCTEQLEILNPSASTPTWDDSFSNPMFNKCTTIGGLLSTGQLFAARIDSDNNRAELEVYDHVNDRWNVRLTGYHTSGSLSSSVTLPSGKLVLLHSGEPTIFNPGYDMVETGNLIGSRSDVSVGIYSPGSLLVSGGRVEGISEIVTLDTLTSDICGNCPGDNFSLQPDLAEFGEFPQGQRSLIQGGGFDSTNGYSGNIYKFSPNSDPSPFELQPVGQLKIPRAGHTTNVLHDGRVLFAGGVPSAANSTAELFNPRTGATTFTQPLNFARFDILSSIVLADGRVMMTGTFGATPEIYDPATNRWTVTAPMNRPRSGAQLAQLTDGRIMAAGGDEPSDPSDRRLVEIYDPKADTWTQVASLNEGRLRFTLTSLPNGLILAAGGLSTTAGSSTEIYDPVTDEWKLSATLPFGAQAHAATYLGDHRVALIGGQQSGGNKIQVYQWNSPITPANTFRIRFVDDTFDNAIIEFIDIPQLAGGGRTRDYGANAPQMYVRRLDGGAHQALQPSLEQNWYTEGNVYKFNWDDFTPGQVWVSGIFNGTPLAPSLLTIPYAPVEDDGICVPIKTAQGTIALICL